MTRENSKRSACEPVVAHAIIFFILLFIGILNANALDYPHTGVNNIGCDSCHFIYGGEPSLLPPWTEHVPQNIDDTQYNSLCWGCHNDLEAPYKRTHSSLQTDNGYGDWTVQCITCHSPHSQPQINTHGSESFLYSGTSTDITATTLTQAGAGWTANEFLGMVLVPNVERLSRYKYSYKITGNTSDTITVEGPIDLLRVSTGNTFAVIYGNLANSTINLDEIIDPAIPKSGSKTVRFFNTTGQDSFADGDANYTGVCEVCHTETVYHRNTAAGDHTHNTGTKCTNCHFHTQGFKGTGCDTCHGYPPAVDTATGGPDGLVNDPGTTGSITAGAHVTHVDTKGFECEICHVTSVGTGPEHNNGSPQSISIGFSLFNGTYLGGIYDGQADVSYDSSEINTTVMNTGSLTCDSIYCHSNAAPFDGVNIYDAPAWDGAVTCASCHDEGGSTTTLSGKHGEHTDESGYAFPCEKCHNQTANGSTSIKTESYHVNNVKDVIFSAGGTYNTGTRACTNTYCHSDAAGGAPNTAVAFSAAVTMDCTSCHNGRTNDDTSANCTGIGGTWDAGSGTCTFPDQTSCESSGGVWDADNGCYTVLTMNSNGHARLVSNKWVRKYKCYYCHDDTMDSANNIKDLTKHVNETKDVVMNSNWHITGSPDPTYDSGTKVCDNTYCHSDGTSVNPDIKAVAWTDGRMRCNSCHGHADGTCTECHSDGITAWAPGEEWKSAMPMYTNTGAGTAKANTHERHLLTDFNCDNCHSNTIANGTCTSCHNGGAPSGDMGEVEHINPAYHVNKVKDMAFKSGGTYNQVNKTCSSTSCHTGSDPQWGDSVNSNIICMGCHGTTENDIDDFTPSNDTRAKINISDWESSGHGRVTASGNYESGNPPADFPGNPCIYCHDNDVLHNDTTNPYRLRQHDQFANRFEKECVYCHMEGLDSECFNCHNATNSLAPQLADITTPDHTGYTDEQTSCVASCHDTDDNRHDTDAELWTSTQKNDVRNQYIMMGVCLVCHDDDSNGKCTSCHTGPQYTLGFDPGSGLVQGTSKATSTHFGYKHYAAYEADGTWKGGKFCWDCHDPHGDSNIYMIQDNVAIETDGTFGTPLETRNVVFTRNQSGMDYAKSSPPYDGICNVCHEQAGQHYQHEYGDGHQAGRVCTTCHEHRFTDSHASGKACDSCHANKPIARHEAFGQPRDCTKCHNGIIKNRVDILGQLSSNSHHIQGVEISNKHCYACHWEATSVGTINTDYHEGYNYKTYQSTSNAPANLVVWGPGARPTTYEDGVTAVTFQATKIGTAEERAEVAKVTQMCLACHSDQNSETRPFNIVDPDNGDCKTPRQYAWDRSSIAARYSDTGTTTWGKYTGTSNAAKKDITKAFSAHGNAVNNQGGWSASEGYDGVTPNTRNGTENVQCFDCHSSHGSKAEGITSSYMTFNGTYNGANLKETQAGKGGYLLTYKGVAGGGAVNPYNVGAAQCFDCHENANKGTMTTPGKFTPWGYNETFGATAPIFGYKDTSKFGDGTKGSTARYSYRASRSIIGGHLNASSDLVGLDGTSGTGDEAQGAINGLCTPCHDPHGVSPTLGENQAYAVPLLKGTWMTSPYKEDVARTQGGTGPICDKANCKDRATGYIRYPRLIYDDAATFGGSTRISEDDTKFAGLCLRCHPKDNLTDGVNNNGAWASLDRVHESVKGWGDNEQHSYPCAKCHQAHNSGLPRLVQTNCLDDNHRGRVTSGGQFGYYSGGKQGGGGGPRGKRLRGQNCHPTGSWPDNRWNDVTPW